jgi:catechol 2,3-dioxygenase-like lactoylglutathione lyase family enzyme
VVVDEKTLDLEGRSMITHVSLQPVWVDDIDEAKAFYIDKLGFVEHTDVTMGEFRWCTVNHPDHPELQLTLSTPESMLEADDAAAMRRLLAKGVISGGGLNTEDCRAAFEELKGRGVEFIQEPQDRPYGVEAVLRDNSGNWWVLVENRPYTQADLDTAAANA